MSPYKIILGSQSPRRRELLASMEIPFRAVNIEADESFPAHLQGGDIAAYIARQKAAAYLPYLQENDLLITADTIVWADGQMLGKPQDEADARRMLHILSGNTHQVYTAVCISTSQLLNPSTFIDCTHVSFRVLTDEEIDYYIREYKPFDKAGAYGIQEWIGEQACIGLDGSFTNVMGLPTERLAEALQNRLQFRCSNS